MRYGCGNLPQVYFYKQNKKSKRYTRFQKRGKLRFDKQLLVFLITLIIFLGGILTKLPLSIAEGIASSHLWVGIAAKTIQLPLSTRGAKIVDAKGKRVLLKGVNWFGIETNTHAPHGLWRRDYKEMLAQIKQLGYNFIRLPYSVQALRSTDVSGIDFSIGSNKELEAKTPLEVMDLIIQESDRQGLLILLDSHRLNDERIPELWYGDGFSEANWINTWIKLAIRYKNQANVIGADLKNEPHGKASWGTNKILTDWRLAAERVGNAILNVNPNWLIVVQGVENNVPGQKLKNYWHGGNLEGVKDYPVRLSRRDKLVYSAHEYGPGVYNQPYFSEKNFPKNLSDRWQRGFYYISRQNIAPILIGEFGGRLSDTSSPEGIWQSKFVKYIRQKKLSFAYWSWNPNSVDTGGILKDDWQSVDIQKQQLLSQLLDVETRNFASPPRPIASPPPSVVSEGIRGVNSGASPSSPLSRSASVQLNVTTDIYSNWQTGFCVSFKIKNFGSNKVDNWQLKFQMKQAAINNSWNANFKERDFEFTATPLDWGRVIEPNQVRDIGFCANKLGDDYQPTQIKVI
ncbi:MAG: cellulase family glycosylhydrolase [Tolypothrix brevis GSE-NOS-MK-07-07A]|nr:cellulase family glycosylhydrolase [Tolypothrix brevis GSE-NOS-MK-07-07A]